MTITRLVSAVAAAALCATGAVALSIPTEAGEPLPTLTATAQVNGVAVAIPAGVAAVPEGTLATLELTLVSSAGAVPPGIVTITIKDAAGTEITKTTSSLTDGKVSWAWPNALKDATTATVTWAYVDKASGLENTSSIGIVGQAVPVKVTVAKLATVKVAKGKKATIKPSVAVTGNAELKKTVMTVKQGSKTIAKNKTSVKLPAGKYKVTTKATYRTFAIVAGPSTSTQELVAKAGESAKVSCKVGQVTTAKSGSTVISVILFDLECTGDALPTPIKTEHTACPSYNCTALGIRLSGVPSWGGTFTATYTPAADVFTTRTVAGDPVTTYSKNRTAIKTQTLVVKAKK